MFYSMQMEIKLWARISSSGNNMVTKTQILKIIYWNKLKPP